MKFSFSSNAFKLHSLLDAIEQIADAGYTGVEIMCDIPHAYPPSTDSKFCLMIKQAISNRRLTIANLNAFMLYAIDDTWHPSFIEKEETKRLQRLEHTLNCLHLAKYLGARTISIEPGGPLDGVTRNWALGAFQDAVEVLLKTARELDIVLLVEPEPNLLIETSKQFLDFADRVASPYLGLNFDIGHFYCVGEDPAELVPHLASFTHHYHLEDIAASREHRHLLPGKGAIRLDKVLTAIQESNYDGYVTVELYPYDTQPAEAARQALSYLKKIRALVL